MDSTPTIIDAINASTKMQINQNLKILCIKTYYLHHKLNVFGL